MTKRLGFVFGLIAGLALAAPVWADAEPLYRVQSIYQVQHDSGVSEWVVVDNGWLKLRPGMSGTVFVGDASVTLIVAQAGTEQLLVDFTMTTLPPAARVVSRQALIDVGRSIDIYGLKYKGHRNARVRIEIAPGEGELECDLGGPKGARNVEEFAANIPLHGAPSMLEDSLGLSEDALWYSDPSAHFEVYYVPNSYGDFGWNMVRDYLERELEQFQSVFDFKAMQRVNYFIAPCRVPEISWSKHRMWAVDPVTFKAYAVFNKQAREVTGIATNMNYLYRSLGYAPMLMVEGAARGFDYNHYYAKQLKWRGMLPNPLATWRTYDYRNSPDSALQIAAGSFMNYLIGTRGLPKFMKLYKIADDFNADSALTAAYDETPVALRKDWEHFLDTMRVLPHLANYFYSRSKALGRNVESIDLLKALIQVDTIDVGRLYDDLSLLYFLEGQYDNALYAMDQARKVAAGKGRRAQMTASANFFLGKLKEARRAYDNMMADTSDQGSIGAANVMYAWLEQTEGNLKKAETILDKMDSARIVLEIDRMEAEIIRGQIRRGEGDDAVADSLFKSALVRIHASLSARPSSADLYMRAGEAYVGLGQADTAFAYLNMAEFLEYRPYYVGRILVAIGNAYDLLGMREQALAYYQRVLDEPTSYPTRKEARRYMREPFKAPGA